LNSSDDLLDELRRKQAEGRESKLTKIKGFFRRNSKRFLIAGLFAVLLSVLAVRIGFTVTVNITSTRILFQGHPCHGYLCEGTVNATFSPILYPVNHLFGSEFSAPFARISEPYDSSGESVKKSLIIETLLREFPVNIPFFFVIGYVIAVGLSKSMQKVRNMRKM